MWESIKKVKFRSVLLHVITLKDKSGGGQPIIIIHFFGEWLESTQDVHGYQSFAHHRHTAELTQLGTVQAPRPETPPPPTPIMASEAPGVIWSSMHISVGTEHS